MSLMPPPIRGARPSLLLAVFLISLAALGLQVLQIRIFAFALWHHLAFLVISIAILGFGAAGAFTASIARLRPKDPSNAIGWAGIAFAITALIGARVLAIEPVDVFAQIGIGEIVQVALYYLVFAAPYFCAGYIISLALAYETKSVPRLYFINLTGSGVGCFLIFATLSPLGAEGSMLVFTALGSIVAVISGSAPVVRGGGALLTVLLLAGIPFAAAVNPRLRMPRMVGILGSSHPLTTLSATSWLRNRLLVTVLVKFSRENSYCRGGGSNSRAATYQSYSAR